MGSYPQRLSEGAAGAQREANDAISSPFSSAHLSLLGRVCFLLTFSMTDSTGITWRVAGPFHRGIYLLAQLLSLEYFVSQKISR